MKDFIRYILFVCIAVFFVSACSKGDIPNEPDVNDDKEEHPYLNLSVSDTIQVNENAVDITISFVTNRSWRATSNQQWTTLSVSDGNKGTNTIKVLVEKNNDYNNRTAVISINADLITKEVLIEQTKCYSISLDKEQYDVSYLGDTLYIKFMSNLECEVESDSEWAKILQHSRTRSLQTSELVILVAPNMNLEQRSTKILIGNKERNLKKEITIVQEAYHINNDGGNPNGNIGNM